MIQEEIWKPVKGYEGYYEISNKGRVKSVERHVKQENHLRYVPEKIKTIRMDAYGYPSVTLCKNRVSRTRAIHRLLMEAFVPNPENKPYIDHINTDKTDYRLENLRWVTAKENANNPLTLQHCRENTYIPYVSQKANQTKVRKGTKNAPTKVYQYSKDGKLLASYSSARQAQLKTGVHSTQIRFVADDCTQSAGGFLWTTTITDEICYQPRKSPTAKPVLYYDKNGNLLGEYPSINAAARSTGVDRTTISNNLNSVAKPRKYIFRYKEDCL